MKLSEKSRRILEVSANCAIIAVAIVIVVNLAWSRFRPKPVATSPPSPSAGNAVSLAGVNWKENGSTLLLVLQKGCVYCEASASFYRKLFDERKGQLPRMMVVIPGEPSDTARYLSNQQIKSDLVINASLDSVNVSATPTLLLVDQAGHVQNVWIGKLNENRQTEVRQTAFGLE